MSELCRATYILTTWQRARLEVRRRKCTSTNGPASKPDNVPNGRHRDAPVRTRTDWFGKVQARMITGIIPPSRVSLRRPQANSPRPKKSSREKRLSGPSGETACGRPGQLGDHRTALVASERVNVPVERARTKVGRPCREWFY